jgi:hypothetical protein
VTDTNALADQLEALAAKATPGPWEADTIGNEGEYGSGPDTHSGFKSPVMLDPSGKALFDAVNGDLIEVHEEYDEDGCYAWDEPGRCNFALIAALRNNLPAIIAALRAEQALAERDAEIVRLRELLEWYAEQFCELGTSHECCGRLSSDDCSGCKARQALGGNDANNTGENQ